MSRRASGDQLYKGWRIYDQGEGYHPVTGRWVAVRHGVELCANTGELLRRMIDTRPEWPPRQPDGGGQ